jgi:hypothetical protein
MEPKYKVGYLVVDVFSAYGDFHMDTVGIIVGVIVRNPPIITENDVLNNGQSIIYRIHWRHDNKTEPLGEDLLDLWCMVYDKEGNVVHGPKPVPSILDL